VGPSVRPQGVTALVVEDEAPLRQAVAEMLRKTGADVSEAADGSAAIDLLHANKGKISVLLLDMTIPGASPDQVIAEAAHSSTRRQNNSNQRLQRGYADTTYRCCAADPRLYSQAV
jgi:CheY-like chemotaxis protein